jgi:GT2 family glycosyltransferase
VILARVSIVIPTRHIDRYAIECVAECKRLEGVDADILVLPDEFTPQEMSSLPPDVTVIPTGPVLPGRKRNIATHAAVADVVAYIDADARPRSDWAFQAIACLENPEIGAVGGPGVTPVEDRMLQRLSGEIYASPMMGRANRIRYLPGPEQVVSDMHSCNLVAKKSVIIEAGGWSEVYWPGEDTLLCRAIEKTGKKILYSPKVVVFHHRRATVRGHLRQTWSFGVHRGHFFRRYPENSRRLLYGLPVALLAYIASIPFVWFLVPNILVAWLLPLLAYAIAVVAASTTAHERKLMPLVSAGVLASHLVYGMGFLRGILSPDVSKGGTEEKQRSVET